MMQQITKTEFYFAIGSCISREILQLDSQLEEGSNRISGIFELTYLALNYNQKN